MVTFAGRGAADADTAKEAGGDCDEGGRLVGGGGAEIAYRRHCC